MDWLKAALLFVLVEGLCASDINEGRTFKLPLKKLLGSTLSSSTGSVIPTPERPIWKIHKYQGLELLPITDNLEEGHPSSPPDLPALANGDKQLNTHVYPPAKNHDNSVEQPSPSNNQISNSVSNDALAALDYLAPIANLIPAKRSIKKIHLASLHPTEKAVASVHQLPKEEKTEAPVLHPYSKGGILASIFHKKKKPLAFFKIPSFKYPYTIFHRSREPHSDSRSFGKIIWSPKVHKLPELTKLPDILQLSQAHVPSPPVQDTQKQPTIIPDSTFELIKQLSDHIALPRVPSLPTSLFPLKYKKHQLLKPYIHIKLPAKQITTKSDQKDINNSVGPPSSPDNSYGPPPPPADSYGLPPYKPVNTYEPPPPTVERYGPPPPPENSYGPPSPPENSYGPPSPPENSYGPPSPPENSYGPPSPPENSYGSPSPSENSYEVPSPPENNHGLPPSIENSYGPPSSPIDASRLPTPAESYGLPQNPVVIYGPPPPVDSYGPPPPRDSFGPPPPKDSYGPPSPADTYGPPPLPSDSYGPPPPTDSHGPPPPADSHGPPPQKQIDTYGPPPLPSDSYGPPPPADSYGPPPLPSDSYGPPPPADSYGPPPLPSDSYGPPPPADSYGPPPQKQIDTYRPPPPPADSYGLPPPNPAEIYGPPSTSFSSRQLSFSTHYQPPLTISDSYGNPINNGWNDENPPSTSYDQSSHSSNRQVSPVYIHSKATSAAAFAASQRDEVLAVPPAKDITKNREDSERELP